MNSRTATALVAFAHPGVITQSTFAWEVAMIFCPESSRAGTQAVLCCCAPGQSTPPSV